MIDHQEEEDHGTELAVHFNRAVINVYKKGGGQVSTRGVLVACGAIIEAYIGQIEDLSERRAYLAELGKYLADKFGVT